MEKIKKALLFLNVLLVAVFTNMGVADADTYLENIDPIMSDIFRFDVGEFLKKSNGLVEDKLYFLNDSGKMTGSVDDTEHIRARAHFTSSRAQDIYCILAIYDSNARMIETMVCKSYFKENESVIMTTEPLNVNYNYPIIVKAFLWDKNHVPLHKHTWAKTK